MHKRITSKKKENIVRAIQEGTLPLRLIAEKYGVSIGTVQNYGKTARNVTTGATSAPTRTRRAALTTLSYASDTDLMRQVIEAGRKVLIERLNAVR